MYPRCNRTTCVVATEDDQVQVEGSPRHLRALPNYKREKHVHFDKYAVSNLVAVRGEHSATYRVSHEKGK